MRGERGKDRLHVLGQHHVAPGEVSPGPRRREQCQQSARAQAAGDGRLLTGRAGEQLQVIEQRGRGMYGVHLGLRSQQHWRVQHGRQLAYTLAAPAGFQQGALGAGVGISQRDSHQKAVELRFRQRRGAHERRRVLGRNHEKGVGQWPRHAAFGHLPLLHRFEQGALGAWGGAVDLVGQQQFGENRPRLVSEAAARRVPDADPQQVGGQQVGRELHPPEPQPQRAGKGLGQRRLAHAGLILDQQVPPRQQARQRQAQLRGLAQNHPVELVQCPVNGLIRGAAGKGRRGRKDGRHAFTLRRSL